MHTSNCRNAEMPHYRFTGKARLDKSVNSLLGLVEGCAIDSVINENEIHFLNMWISEHHDVRTRHPFNELVPVVQQAIEDQVLTEDERQDILWLCEKLRSNEFFDQTTADLQRLHALLGGIAADAEINTDELLGLSQWLGHHDHLRTSWPFDEVDTVVTQVMQDKYVDAEEHAMLMAFFSEFTAVLDDRTITNPVSSENNSLAGICATCPEIMLSGSVFCLTGQASNYTKSSFAGTVEKYGGIAKTSVSSKLDYLVIGANGNPCWAYSCYGRKVEQAVRLRKEGQPLVIVHETDFHDAIQDL